MWLRHPREQGTLPGMRCSHFSRVSVSTRILKILLKRCDEVPIRTKRWNDPAEPDDGFRLLVTRYRPRGVAKADETWDAWQPALGPGKALHRAVYTDSSSPIPWPLYRRQYLAEQRANAGA